MNEQNHMTKVQEFKGQSEGPSLYKPTNQAII